MKIIINKKLEICLTSQIAEKVFKQLNKDILNLEEHDEENIPTLVLTLKDILNNIKSLYNQVKKNNKKEYSNLIILKYNIYKKINSLEI